MASNDFYPIPGTAKKPLRISETEDALRMNRDQVSRFALWREATVPAIFWMLCLAFLAYQGWWLSQHRAEIGRQNGLFHIAFCAGAIYLAVWIIRDAMRNAGIVTEISITPQLLSWQKRSLWRVDERSWPIAQVRYAQRANRILKIHLRTGVPLGAFSYFPVSELELAAGRINDFLAKHPPATPIG